MSSVAIGRPFPRRLSRHARTAIASYLFIAPAVILMAVFLFWPTIFGIAISFTNYSVVQSTKFVGLENYRQLLHDPVAVRGFVNAVLYSLMVIPTLIVLPLLLALLVNQQLPFVSAFRAAYYVPVVTSMVVFGYIWKYMYQTDGIIDQLLLHLGVIHQPIAFLASSTWALPAVAFVTIAKAPGYYMVLYLAGLQNVPVEVHEAAKIDGANALQRLWNITIPLLRPMMTLVIIIVTMGSLRVFGEVYVMTQGGPANATQTVLYDIYHEGFELFHFGYASAISVVMGLVIIVLSVINLRLSERDGKIW